MPRPDAKGAGGQAGAEFVALLPLLVGAVAAVAQIVLAGHAAWAGAQAARAAARAHAIGAEVEPAARSALPPHLERRLRVEPDGDGQVEVRIRVPAIVPSLDLGDLAFRSAFDRQGQS